MLNQALLFLHDTVLMTLVSVSLLYLATTLKTRLAFRRILVSWPQFKQPLIPVRLFIGLGLSLALWAVTAYVTGNARWASVFGYGLMLLAMIAGTFLANRAVVTEKTVLRHVGRACEGLGWGQIEDYVIHEDEDHARFVFFYQDEAFKRQRFELLVPKRHQHEMQQIVERKIDARFDYVYRHSYGSKALND